MMELTAQTDASWIISSVDLSFPSLSNLSTRDSRSDDSSFAWCMACTPLMLASRLIKIKTFPNAFRDFSCPMYAARLLSYRFGQ